MSTHTYGPFDTFTEIDTIVGAVTLAPGEILTIDDNDPDLTQHRTFAASGDATVAPAAVEVPVEDGSVDTSAGGDEDEDPLDGLTKDELLQVAKGRNVKVFKSWSNDKIIAAIRGE